MEPQDYTRLTREQKVEKSCENLWFKFSFTTRMSLLPTNGCVMVLQVVPTNVSLFSIVFH